MKSLRDRATGDDFLAQVSVAWGAERGTAEELGLRMVTVRTGVVLAKDGGALAKMLPPFKAGVGGPVAGGKQYMPWIHLDDEVSLILAALDGDWSGPFNAAAPTPVTNKELSKTLGKVLRRPAFAPVPSLAVKALYGEMAEIVTTGQRAGAALAKSSGSSSTTRSGESRAWALAGSTAGFLGGLPGLAAGA